MISGFLIAAALLQIGGAWPETLVVKDANRAVRIPLTETRSGPMVAPQALAPLVAVAVRRATLHEYSVRVNGTDVRVWPGMRPGMPPLRLV